MGAARQVNPPATAGAACEAAGVTLTCCPEEPRWRGHLPGGPRAAVSAKRPEEGALSAPPPAAVRGGCGHRSLIKAEFTENTVTEYHKHEEPFRSRPGSRRAGSCTSLGTDLMAASG